MRRAFAVLPAAILAMSLAGCHDFFLRDADREVHELIRQRQLAAIGESHPAPIDKEDGHFRSTESMYSFVPHPVDSAVPGAFRQRRDVSTQPTTQATTQPVEDALLAQPSEEPLQVFTLFDALAYATRHSREYQFQKEQLYLAALDLSLERFLWTPQFSADVSAEFANYGQVRDFDRAMTVVAQAAAQQRLPLGGDVTAAIISSWMRDLGVHTTSGETGQMILEANIPLLRGAGKVAYESRYQAERNLIYAVRDFEHFRRVFLVDVARSYFDLLALQARIDNARNLVDAFAKDLARAHALAESGRVLLVEEGRAEVEYLIAQNDVVNAIATYEAALDRFKIVLGMPVDTRLDLADQDIELYEPDVTESDAIATALRYRLDLLNELDAVDDARRGIVVARNNLLPDLDLQGSVSLDSDPDRKNVMSYNTERTTWRGSVALEIPVNRKAERNAYRAAFVDYRRFERAFDLRADEVRAEVRDALRRLEETRISMEIQLKNIEINEFRAELARTQFELGTLASNRDVVEAQNAYTDAQNRYAQALSDYRTAILAFLRDTGTLRVDDNGKWVPMEPVASAQAPAVPTKQ